MCKAIKKTMKISIKQEELLFTRWDYNKFC